MGLFEAILLGIIEGITEFLPVSSTAHLTIAEKLFGLQIDKPDIVAFTAIIQVGAVLATVVYFRKDIWRLVTGWCAGLLNGGKRGADYKFGWAVIIGSIPIGLIGFVFKDQIENGVRSLWLVATALIIWSGVMWAADATAKQDRKEQDANWHDTLIIGIVQCLALIPGVSRSGATLSAGLFRGLDRVAVTRLSFFLSIPALLAAGALETMRHSSAISTGVGWPATILATVISFVVAYAAIAWLLNYIAKHSFMIFIIYRLALGALLLIMLAVGIIAAT